MPFAAPSGRNRGALEDVRITSWASPWGKEVLAAWASSGKASPVPVWTPGRHSPPATLHRSVCAWAVSDGTASATPTHSPVSQHCPEARPPDHRAIHARPGETAAPVPGLGLRVQPFVHRRGRSRIPAAGPFDWKARTTYASLRIALRHAGRTCASVIAGESTKTCCRHETRDEIADTSVAQHTPTTRERPPGPPTTAKNPTRPEPKAPAPHSRKTSARTNPNLRAIQHLSGTQTCPQTRPEKHQILTPTP